MLGIGAAWYEREHRGLGVPFPPTAERFERLEEAIQICLQMWSDDNGAFEGRHYQLAETLCSPPPVSQPRPRIMIGGSGEKKTLRLVAQYADACNIFGDPATIAHKVDVLKRHCDAVGRDANEIEVTSNFGAQGDVDSDEIVRRLEDYAAVGVSTVMAGMVGADPIAHLNERWAPAMKRIADLEPARL